MLAELLAVVPSPEDIAAQLAAVRTQASDPTPMIIAGMAAVIAFLANVLGFIVLGGVRGVRDALKSLQTAITGDGGLTPGLVTRLTALEGLVNTHGSRINALESNTLTRELFERETGAQNARLDDLKATSSQLTTKVDRINLTVAGRPWSAPQMPAVRPPLAREEPPSDPPIPPRPRPRVPSRPGT